MTNLPLTSTDKDADYGWESDAAPMSCSYLGNEILQILNRLRSKRILDIGSGNGALCGLLAKHGFDVAGLEYDKRGVEISRKYYPELSFYNLGVQDDPNFLIQEQGKFDAIVSTEVIEHLYSPQLLAKFARRAIKDDGFLIVSTPYHGYLKNLLLSLFNAWDKHHTALWEGGHIKFWSKITLVRLMDQNGFRFVDFRGVGRMPFLWKSMILTFKTQAFADCTEKTNAHYQ